MTNAILFRSSDSEIIRIDKHGFHYRGQFIEDAGEAHRLLVEFLRTQMPETNWRHADEPAPNFAETRSSLGDAPQPVPVSERLPRPEDCDAEGKCWWGRSESNDWSADWTLATHEAVAEFCEFSPQTVWLPAHSLPLPTVND